MSAIDTTGQQTLLFNNSSTNRPRRMGNADTVTMDVNSWTFTDTTDQTPVDFDDGITVAAGQAITGDGALTLGVAAGAFDITVKMGDAAGVQKVSFTDSADVEIMSIDSDGNVDIGNNLNVQGTTTTFNSETVLLDGLYTTQNADYTSGGGVAAGNIYNVAPVSGVNIPLSITSFTGGDTINVGATPVTALTIGDILVVAGANNAANDGLYEIASLTATTIVIATAVTASLSGLVKNIIVNDAVAGGLCAQTAISVLRANSDNSTFSIGFGDSAASITFATLGTGSGNDLDGAYTLGRTITNDLGPIIINGDAATTGGALDINPNVLAETSFQMDITWDDGAYTGTLGGLNIDYSPIVTSITNAGDVSGITLTGATNAGTGDSIGLLVAAGWDIGARFVDDVTLNFGTDDNWTIQYDETTDNALEITGAAATGTTVTGFGYTLLGSDGSGASGTAGTGGAVSMTSGAGGIGAATFDGGDGGGMTITAGLGGLGVTTGDGGNGGVLALASGAGADSTTVVGSLEGDGGATSLTAGVGGASLVATGTGGGGTGGSVTVTAGAGGAATASADGIGGNGGLVSVTAGAGAAGGDNGGDGGAAALAGGAAGASANPATGSGGDGGDVSITGAAGANSDGSSAATQTGNGGSIALTAGKAGDPSGTSVTAGLGAAGAITLTSGAGANTSNAGTNAGTSGVGGAITITTGVGGESNSGAAGDNAGTGGAFTVTTGAGGNGHEAGNGGAITLTAGDGGILGALGSVRGVGGAITFNVGDGLASGAGDGGTGGAFALNGGDGGNCGSSLDDAGDAGAMTITGGGGGDCSGTGSETTGNGSAITITAGVGGASDGATATHANAGTGGSLTLVAGAGGVNTDGTAAAEAGAGGSVTITGGAGGDATAGATDDGDGGDVTITGGASGALGGSIAIDAGLGTTTTGSITIGVTNSVLTTVSASTDVRLGPDGEVTDDGRLVSDAGCTDGDALYIVDDTGTAKYALSDASADSSARLVGFAANTAATDAAVFLAGVPGTIVLVSSTLSTIGAKVYVSIAAGAVTETAPSGTGEFVMEIGYTVATGAGTSKIMFTGVVSIEQVS